MPGGILKDNTNSTYRNARKLTFKPISQEFDLNNSVKNKPTNFEKEKLDARYWNNKQWSFYLVKFIREHKENPGLYLTKHEKEMFHFLDSEFSVKLRKKNPAADKLYERLDKMNDICYLEKEEEEKVEPIIKVDESYFLYKP